MRLAQYRVFTIFIESSPKRHAVFAEVEVDDDSLLSTLKSQSKTRWSCRWEAVKAVDKQLPRIIATLLKLNQERDTKTYVDSSALLNAVSDFKFVFGVSVLKVILSMTASLSSYLQKRTMNVVTARKTAEMTTKALQDCRNEESFYALWERVLRLLAKQSRNASKTVRFPSRKPSSHASESHLKDFRTLLVKPEVTSNIAAL
jgi:hypothetical protein